MAMLISVGTSSGEGGRCDAKCYGAQGDACHCCCGGLNHGVGYAKAVDNTTALAEEIISRWAQEHDEPLMFAPALEAGALFDLPTETEVDRSWPRSVHKTIRPSKAAGESHDDGLFERLF